MEVTLADAVVAVVAALVGATIQGSIGFGMNLVTVPVIALAVPEALPATVVLLGIPISLAMLRHEHRSVDRPGVGWVMAGRLPGTVLGTWVVTVLATEARAALVGTFVLLAVVTSLTAPPLRVHAGSQGAAGFVSGITGTAAGIGGPPLALLYQYHPGPTMRSTLAASFFFGTLLSTAALTLAGEVGTGDLALAALMTPFVVLGSVAARGMAHFLDRGWLRPAVLAFAAVSAVVVIADAVI